MMRMNPECVCHEGGEDQHTYECVWVVKEEKKSLQLNSFCSRKIFYSNSFVNGSPSLAHITEYNGLQPIASHPFGSECGKSGRDFKSIASLFIRAHKCMLAYGRKTAAAKP